MCGKKTCGWTISFVDTKSGANKSDFPPSSSTATTSSAALRNVPQPVNVISQQLLEDLAMQSMEDALKNVRGVGLSHSNKVTSRILKIVPG